MKDIVISGPEEPKGVCILGRDLDALRELDAQLEQFGYVVTSTDDIETFNIAVAKDKPKVIIVHSTLTSEEVAWLRKLQRDKRDSVIFPQLIMISTRDDFSSRLAAARLGSQGFFSTKADIIQIIDKIEYLVSKYHTPRTYHVLLVEDDDRHVRFYTHVLEGAGIMTTVVADPNEALEIINNQSIDLVLMDFVMPDCNGQELAIIIRQHKKHISLPIIFLSARDDLQSLLIDTGLGIDEFMVKPVTGEQLVSVVRSRAQRSAELHVLMARDSFTGLLNHDHFMDMLEIQMGQVKRFKTNTAYATIDIDNFKQINDKYGHVAGDNVIKSLSRLLQQRLRRTDIIGRCGGQEFSIIMPDCSPEDASVVIESMREKFEEIPFKLAYQDVKVTFSAGLTMLNNFESVDALIKAAGHVLSEAKKLGRNRLIVA